MCFATFVLILLRVGAALVQLVKPLTRLFVGLLWLAALRVISTIQSHILFEVARLAL